MTQTDNNAMQLLEMALAIVNNGFDLMNKAIDAINSANCADDNSVTCASHQQNSANPASTISAESVAPVDGCMVASSIMDCAGETPAYQTDEDTRIPGGTERAAPADMAGEDARVPDRRDSRAPGGAATPKLPNLRRQFILDGAGETPTYQADEDARIPGGTERAASADMAGEDARVPDRRGCPRTRRHRDSKNSQASVGNSFWTKRERRRRTRRTRMPAYPAEQSRLRPLTWRARTPAYPIGEDARAPGRAANRKSVNQ